MVHRKITSAVFIHAGACLVAFMAIGSQMPGGSSTDATAATRKGDAGLRAETVLPLDRHAQVVVLPAVSERASESPRTSDPLQQSLSRHDAGREAASGQIVRASFAP